ncbi:helix-turn-helix domain-containing protein [Algoriphagus confluentis]|uniref:HTH araC/xylS-type domain-containing protein n=1 Tax=Algoriphagus confluentis TaxID=1697556 RepID=A0ABQ6PND0_9BACT|nr:hypothetical protein Aconfl_21160 [Algoriphagus confluentis]
MKFILSVKDLIYLSAIFLGFITSLLLILYSFRGEKKSNILIGFSFATLSYAILFAFLISSGYYLLVPSLYRTGNIAALLFMPLFYLYIYKESKREGFKKRDLIHFLPMAIYILDFFPVLFTASVEEKTQLIKSEIDNPSVFVYFNQSRFFPPNFYTVGRTLLIMIYWIGSLNLLSKEQAKIREDKSLVSKEWILWARTYVYGASLLFLPFFALFYFADSQLSYDLVHFTGAIFILGNALIILFFPKILYGISSPPPSEKLKETPSSFPLGEEKSREIQEKLDGLMGISKRYLEPGYTINSMAKDMDVPAYLLTQYINRNLGLSFSDLINQHRIEECCRKIEVGEHKLMTLEGLAHECGFNNRNSFITSFKKFKNKTPSEYLKELQKEKSGPVEVHQIHNKKNKEKNRVEKNNAFHH